MVFRPTAFGKYILLRRIAIGGMAEVFRAKVFGAEGFEKMVAIKRMLPHLSSDQQFVGMFINEAKLAASLTHANIVQIFDFGSLDNQYYLSMEYVRGKDVADIIRALRERSLRSPIEMACHVIIQALNGLDYAHRRADAQGQSVGLVHRDMSPHNLIVSFEGEVKILDFGIAKAKSSTVQTTGGVLKGKYSYMSPEQAHGMQVDHRTDIFSLGICFYELLTLTKMFQGQNDLSVLERVRETNFIRPRDLNETIPVELERLLLKALEKNPDDRWTSAAEWRTALESFLFQTGLQYSTSWLGNFMHEIFRAELDKEQGLTQEEDSRAEDLRLAARREARVEAIRATVASQQGGPAGRPPIREVEPPLPPPAMDTQRASKSLEEMRAERAEVEAFEDLSNTADMPEVLDIQELPPVTGEEEDAMPTVEMSRPLPGAPGRVSIPPRVRGKLAAPGAPPPPVGSPPEIVEVVERPAAGSSADEDENTIQDSLRQPRVSEPGGQRALMGAEFEESLPTLRKPRTPTGPAPFPDTTLVPRPPADAPEDSTMHPGRRSGSRSNLRLAVVSVLAVVAATVMVAWWVRGSPPPPTPPTPPTPDDGPGMERPEPSVEGPNRPGDALPGPTPADAGPDEETADAGDPTEPPVREPVDAGLTAPVPLPAPEDAGVRPPPDDVKPPKPPPPPRRQKRRPNCPSRGFGKLTVGVVGGWATVYIDGEKIKNTPLVDYSARAGWRKVELRDGGGSVVRVWSVCLRGNGKLKLLHQ